MAHHRCSRCKEESHPRHKYQGGVYCESCITWIRGYRRPHSGRGWLGSIWDMITDLVDWFTAPFTHSHKVALKDKASMVKVAYTTVMNKARDIPMDAQTGAPQKR